MSAASALREAIGVHAAAKELHDRATSKLREIDREIAPLEEAFDATATNHQDHLARHELGMPNELAKAKAALERADAPLAEANARRNAVESMLPSLKRDVDVAEIKMRNAGHDLAAELAAAAKRTAIEKWRAAMNAHAEYLKLLTSSGVPGYGADATLGHREDPESIYALARSVGLDSSRGFALNANDEHRFYFHADLLKKAST